MGTFGVKKTEVDLVRGVRQAHLNGYSYKEIAIEFGMNYFTVYGIVKKKAHKYI